MAELRVHPDPQSLNQALARSIADRAAAAVLRGTEFSLVLAGGSTPRALYRLLAAEYRELVRWAQVHVFWGDERYVPADHPQSNFRMVREALLDHVPIPTEHIHPMSTGYSDPHVCAQAYEQHLRERFPLAWPRFDLVLLGLGTDGHTASLFPHSQALHERERWVVAVQAPVEPPLRLTLTLPVLNHAAHVSFLVVGADKAPALRRALADPPEPAECPASGVRPVSGTLDWWVDEAAARGVASQRFNARDVSVSSAPPEDV
jgi:6-phosphogluconolactonase